VKEGEKGGTIVDRHGLENQEIHAPTPKLTFETVRPYKSTCFVAGISS